MSALPNPQGFCQSSIANRALDIRIFPTVEWVLDRRTPNYGLVAALALGFVEHLVGTIDKLAWRLTFPNFSNSE